MHFESTLLWALGLDASAGRVYRKSEMRAAKRNTSIAEARVTNIIQTEFSCVMEVLKPVV